MIVCVIELGFVTSTLACVLLTSGGPCVVGAGSVLVIVSIMVMVGDVVNMGVSTTKMGVMSKIVVCVCVCGGDGICADSCEVI